MKEQLRLWLPIGLLLLIVAVLGWELLGGSSPKPKMTELPEPKTATKSSATSAAGSSATTAQAPAPAPSKGIQKCTIGGKITYSDRPCPTEASSEQQLKVNPQHNVMEGSSPKRP